MLAFLMVACAPQAGCGKAARSTRAQNCAASTATSLSPKSLATQGIWAYIPSGVCKSLTFKPLPRPPAESRKKIPKIPGFSGALSRARHHCSLLIPHRDRCRGTFTTRSRAGVAARIRATAFCTDPSDMSNRAAITRYGT